MREWRMSWHLTEHQPYTDSDLLGGGVMAQVHLAAANVSMLRRVISESVMRNVVDLCSASRCLSAQWATVTVY
jgi:hypothetical protein